MDQETIQIHGLQEAKTAFSPVMMPVYPFSSEACAVFQYSTRKQNAVLMGGCGTGIRTGTPENPRVAVD